ncbi:MAG: ABC transporter ATP-binding protein, partial [Bacilli bacterium]|nr:ABC transporter ATP-binding protein [Bacilli bacterium]
MKKLLSYIKLYKKEAILGPLFKLLEASFELIIPLVVAKIIDDGIKNQSIGTIIPLFLLMVLLGIVGLLCSVTAQYFSAKAAVGMSSDIRSDVFKKLQSLSYSEIDDLGTSKMVTILTNDINQVQNGVNLTLRLFLRSPFIVFGAMIMAFTININAA